MRITPLVLHAAARLPALTNLFSDEMVVSSMSVTPGGIISLTTPTPHGLPVGSQTSLAIVNADVPNAIVGAELNSDGTVNLTTSYPHDFSSTDYTPVVKLAGFANVALNGNHQLSAVASETEIVVRPSAVLTEVTLTGNEVILERLEDGVVGWHVMTVSDARTLTTPTPEHVARAYTVSSPSVVKNIRVAGALSLDVAKSQYVRGYQRSATGQTDGELAKSWVYICPWQAMRVSQDRNARTDASQERTALSDRRRMMVDGYYVFVALPAENYGGAVGCSDLANGQVLQAVLQTFDGLLLTRNEFWQADVYLHTVVEHGQTLGDYNNATYWHGYSVEAPVELTQFDGIQPFEWPVINEATMTVASGLGPPTPGGALIEGIPIAPTGSVAARQMIFGPAPDGIKHDDSPQPLTAVVKLT